MKDPDALQFSIIVFTLLLFLQPLPLCAQTDSNKLYRDEFASCDAYVEKEKYDKAIECLELLAARFPNEIKTTLRLCELYSLKKDRTRTLLYANRAIDRDPAKSLAPLTFLANKMMGREDADIGVLILNRLSVSNLDTAKLYRVERNRQNYKMRQDAVSNPTGMPALLNLGDSVNSTENEYLPSISLDGRTLVFTRNHGGNEDFFIARRDTTNQYWLKAHNLGYPPNTNMPDGAAKLSADGNYLFYTRCDLRSPDGIRGGGCDIVFSYREDSAWSAPQYFGYTINTTAYEGQPCLSADNKDLYFASNREGGYGGMDIWVSHFQDHLWSKPENLGPAVNSAGDESAPYIHPDNETLYFASTGHSGMGSSDLFVSRKSARGKWQKPLNMGTPVNSEKFDGSIVVSARGNTGYCSSDRNDSRGGLDLYSFTLQPHTRPIPTVCIKGFLSDKFHGNHIYKQPLEFYRVDTRMLNGEESSNAGDGSYTRALQMGHEYVVVCRSGQYRTYKKKISLLHDSIPDIVDLNIRLKQPGITDTLYRATLFSDSSDLSFDCLSASLLDTLVQKWDAWNEDSATVHIFVKAWYYAGDSTADTSYKRNLDLCMQRMQRLNTWFEKKQVACHLIMQDPVMLALKDEDYLFRKLELNVVEFY